MFENLSHLALQQYWWVIVSLLGGLLVFLMFVQGGQTLLGTIAKTEMQKSILVNILGRKWELGYTTLVTFGGAAFAAFPLFYSTSFGGAYWVWIAILFCYTIQAVSYEFRTKAGNFLGQKTYETFLFINGSVGVILIGVAVGTFFTGSNFEIDNMNLSYWRNSLGGLEGAFDFTNLSLGFAIFFLARILGSQYFIKMTDEPTIIENSFKQIKYSTLPFLVFFLYFAGALLLGSGFAYDPTSKLVFVEKYKYFHNLIEMPIVAVIFLLGVVGVLAGIGLSIFKKNINAMFFSGTGTVLTVFAVLLLAGLNNTSFYPSIYDPQSSLTIENASSSIFTLKTMSYVSLIVPFVLAYIVYIWRLMDKKNINEEEINNTPQSY
ncbi:MAG: cytochrome d ubiquinol oxidase subunit II [Bacteroidota bacterium]